MSKKPASLKVHQLAKELNVSSKDIVAWCQKEEIPDIVNHLSNVKIGLAETLRAQFKDAAPSADKLLAGIVREGPVAGVHTIVTADTLSALQRAFDRNTLREFDWKILFQMSPSDSSSLIDSPAASRLGANRAILHSEELGLSEKFRPYF